MKTFDVVVIGAGMAGASIAFELAAELRVLLLEAEWQPGYHTTGRSAALFIPAYGFQHEALRALTAASREQLQSPTSEFHDGSLLRRRGLLYVSTREELPELEATYRSMAEYFPGIQWVGREFTRRVLPGLTDEYGAAAAFDADVFDIDVHGLHRAYLGGLRRRGGEFVCGAEVTALDRLAGFWRVSTGAGHWGTPLVVNAAGAWADRVAELAGVAGVGLQPLRRTAVLIDPPSGAAVDDWPSVVDFRNRFYFKPDAGLLMASPADETPSPPCDAQPEDEDVAYAVHYMEQALGMQVQRVRSAWAGLRSFVADRSPVIGYAPGAEGFFWLAGQGGHGIQIAPATARLAAALLRGESPPEDLLRLGLEPTAISPARLAAV
jgi:D-arginine dehydrogenase